MATPNPDWSKPNRLSSYAILSSGYLFMRVIWGFSWPVLIVMIFRFDFDAIGNILLGLLIAIILCLCLGLLYYWRFRFWIDGENLVLERWFFKLTRISVPLSKIQSISLNQSITKQVFDIAELNVDTAGSAIAEVKLDAIELHLAKALQTRLQELVQHYKPETSEETTEQTTDKLADNRVLLRLNFANLLKVGLTENHLRSSGIILLIASYISQFLTDIGLDEYTDTQIESLETDSSPLQFWLVFIGLFIGLSVLLSLILTLLKYWNFELSQTKNQLITSHGLTKLKEVQIRNSKIQLMMMTSNPLRKLLNIWEVKFKQVGESNSMLTAMNIPGCPKNLRSNLFQLHAELSLPENPALLPVHNFRYYWRWGFNLILCAVLIAFGILTEENLVLGIAFVFSLFLGIITWRNLHYYRLSILPTGLLKQTAWVEETQTFIRYEKIQGIALKQSLIGKKLGFCQLTIYSAAGEFSIPWLPKSTAVHLQNYLLFWVEAGNKTWM